MKRLKYLKKWTVSVFSLCLLLGLLCAGTARAEYGDEAWAFMKPLQESYPQRATN